MKCDACNHKETETCPVLTFEVGHVVWLCRPCALELANDLLDQLTDLDKEKAPD